MRKTIPEGIDVKTQGTDLLIRRRWFSLKVIPLLFFCIAWDSFLFFWYAKAFQGDPANGLNLMMIIFPIAHLAVGIGLSYYVVSSFFNKTDLIINASFIKVKSYPFPWVGNKDLRVGEITGILVRERANKYNKSSYTVMYVDHQNREKKLFSMVETLDQANYIRDEVSDILGVENIKC